MSVYRGLTVYTYEGLTLERQFFESSARDAQNVDTEQRVSEGEFGAFLGTEPVTLAVASGQGSQVAH